MDWDWEGVLVLAIRRRWKEVRKAAFIGADRILCFRIKSSVRLHLCHAILPSIAPTETTKQTGITRDGGGHSYGI